MTKIYRKIKNRIRTIEFLQNRTIKEVEITKEEQEELGNIKQIDNVKLIVSDNPTNKVRQDCFAYLGRGKCYSLTEMNCLYENCPFFRDDIDIKHIERDIERYKSYHKY